MENIIRGGIFLLITLFLIINYGLFRLGMALSAGADRDYNRNGRYSAVLVYPMNLLQRKQLPDINDFEELKW